MSYVYEKIKNIKIDSQSVSFKVESDWKIIDYENENNILSLYCNVKDEHEVYETYKEKEKIFQFNYNEKGKIVDILITNINERYKIEFNENYEVSSLRIINE